ncbi:MAG: hypothetical protein ACE5LU_18470 [Anaerolineae bacterium]
MVRSVVGFLSGFSLALVVSTIGLAMFWGGPTPRGSLPASLGIALLCVWFGGLAAGVIGEQRTLLLGTLVGVAVGGFVGLWNGAFPLKHLFFQVPIWRVSAVPITAVAGWLGGWVAGWLIAPGGFLAGDDRT